MKNIFKNIASKVSRRSFLQGAIGTFLASLITKKAEAKTPYNSIYAGAVSAPRYFKGTGGELIAEQLKAFGVEYIFASNASGLYPIVEALFDRPSLQLIQAKSEHIVAAMMSGYSEASRKIGFGCCSRVGWPLAASNIYNASKDRTGMVLLTDHTDLGSAGRDGHEDAEWDPMYSTITKYRRVCYEGPRITEWLTDAYKLAGAAPGGPTALRVPRDVMYGVHQGPIFPEESVRISTKLAPDPKAVETVARMLLEAKNPLLYVGSEVSKTGARGNVVKLSEMLAIPVAQARSNSADFPTRHPNFIGTYFHPARYPIDLFVDLGARMPDQGSGPQAIPDSAKIIHASIEADQIGKSYAIDQGVLGDVGEFVKALMEAINSLATSERLAKIREERMARVQQYIAGLKRGYNAAARRYWNEAPLTWPRLLHDINQALDPDAIITTEVGTEDWLHWYFSFGDGEKTKIGRTEGRALGWGMGAATGVKLAKPNQQVVALQGDGGFGFAQEGALWTLHNYDIGLLTIFGNNNGYNEPRINGFSKGGRCYRENIDPISDLREDVDLPALAAAFRIKGERVTNPDELQAALQRGIRVTREGRPYLIDVAIARTGLGIDATAPEFSLAKIRTRNV